MHVRICGELTQCCENMKVLHNQMQCSGTFLPYMRNPTIYTHKYQQDNRHANIHTYNYKLPHPVPNNCKL